MSVDPEPEQEGRSALWPSVGEYPIYDPFLYTTMTTDDERNKRFRTALSHLAPGRRILDIGTGQDLLWAREGVQAGARHAVAIEVIEDAFRKAAANLSAFDPQDRITLLHGQSTNLQFAPRADVCVAEIIGSLAGAEGAAAVLTDARSRHLEPGGLVVPHRAETLAAAACLSDLLPEQPVAFAEASLPYLRSRDLVVAELSVFLAPWFGRPMGSPDGKENVRRGRHHRDLRPLVRGPLEERAGRVAGGGPQDGQEVPGAGGGVRDHPGRPADE
ncbi:class I SAM-dependent methyltransferase [Streptomyces avermitilis]|uniref:class I SAM-dependent methyltransferase n=1 Tax=Streptomyces avermitilis TaxID=33903 RepID=UPI0033F305D3